MHAKFNTANQIMQWVKSLINWFFSNTDVYPVRYYKKRNIPKYIKANKGCR